MSEYVIERDLKRARGIEFCHCGGAAIYEAQSRFRRLGVAIVRSRTLCEFHGRAFAIRWELALPEQE